MLRVGDNNRTRTVARILLLIGASVACFRPVGLILLEGRLSKIATNRVLPLVPSHSFHGGPFRRFSSTQATNSHVIDIETVQLEEGDVIAWKTELGTDGNKLERGLVLEDLKVQPLIAKDPSSPDELYVDEDRRPLEILPGDLLEFRIEQAYFSQRMVQDRIHNPHGEHAEDCWVLEKINNE
mmetsp:Transcript_8443/g.13363  ORF Transcript_8443/g.13363 Transcript_8443/m.13363 type:complete len:182 (+) Transcript_8443:513-1058(+)